MIYFPFKLRLSKQNRLRWIPNYKWEQPLEIFSLLKIWKRASSACELLTRQLYWFIILIQEGTSRGAWTGIWRCNTRGSLRVKGRWVMPCRSLLFIEWILIHRNKSEIHVVQYNDYFAVIIALNSLKSTWLSPLTSAYKWNQCYIVIYLVLNMLSGLASIIISCISSSVKCTPRFDITVLISLLQICLKIDVKS